MMWSSLPWVHEVLRLLAVPILIWMAMNADFLRRAISTAPRDLRGIAAILQLKMAMRIELWRNRGVQQIFMDTVARNRKKAAIVDIDREIEWTFEELNEHANRFAHFLQSAGVKPNDVIALVLTNGAHYVAAWLGCTKIGATSAWINTNLKQSSLQHCLEVSGAKLILADDDVVNEVREVTRTTTFALSEVNIEKQSSSEPVCAEPPKFQSVLCFIYTSGTTGLPKAAVIKHLRFYYMAKSGTFVFGCNPSDRLYICLPMYHTSAGVLGIGQTIINGSTCVIAKKFGVRRFWKDCVRFDCTVSQYIGEICRYLLTAPPCPEEKRHRVRLLMGNGLRAAIWTQFVERFNIPNVAELFASTEGTSNLVNFVNKVGSCGFVPIYPFIHKFYPVMLYRADLETGELLRDEEGRAIPCKPGETGVLVCKLRRKDPIHQFEGYINAKDTQKRIVYLPEPAFCSGDILEWDREGFFYFKDRTGDTFRWKGENVSTTEVESVLQDVAALQDATAFGVALPGAEGRAGMLAVVVDDRTRSDIGGVLDLLAERFASNLPSYAVPLFVRVCSQVDKTGTFKLRKTRLQQEGLNCGEDAVFFFDVRSKKYAPFQATQLKTLKF
uniref:long-chain-fatty-acid--CoA ligase n=1 Tax=Steinernema glaseri TaxID=37863 RepID=A0A1I8AJE9_9BILA